MSNLLADLWQTLRRKWYKIDESSSQEFCYYLTSSLLCSFWSFAGISSPEAILTGAKNRLKSQDSSPYRRHVGYLYMRTNVIQTQIPSGSIRRHEIWHEMDTRLYLQTKSKDEQENKQK